LLFCHEILKFFAPVGTQHRVELNILLLDEEIGGSGGFFIYNL
jgi:hypothetical protein